jgi:hypothetical protein
MSQTKTPKEPPMGPDTAVSFRGRPVPSRRWLPCSAGRSLRALCRRDDDRHDDRHVRWSGNLFGHRGGELPRVGPSRSDRSPDGDGGYQGQPTDGCLDALSPLRMQELDGDWRRPC